MLELRQQEDVGVAVQSVPQNPQLEFVVPLWLAAQVRPLEPLQQVSPLEAQQWLSQQ